VEILSAALPNIMFVAGIIAVAIGLGIELKVVPIGNQVGRAGRIGAMTFGILLIVVSVFLYIRPPEATTASSPTAQPTATAPTVAGQQAVAMLEPSATASLLATDIPPAPTDIPPTLTPAPTELPKVNVPDLRGRNAKDASQQLDKLDLQFELHDGSCADIQVSDDQVRSGKKGTIACQSPAAGADVVAGTVIRVVLVNQDRKK
jgi:beta-lactam-binding protein with PASTA domain